MKPFNKDSYYCASKSGHLPPFLCCSLNLTWELYAFIFLLLKDVGWEGDFGGSDSWSSVFPYGSQTEMTCGCNEVSCNLLPSLCSDITASHGVFCLCLLWCVSQLEDFGYFSCMLRLRADLLCADGRRTGKAGLDHGFYFHWGKKCPPPSVAYCFSSLKHCFGEPSEKHDTKRKY